MLYEKIGKKQFNITKWKVQISISLITVYLQIFYGVSTLKYKKFSTYSKKNELNILSKMGIYNRHTVQMTTTLILL